MCGAAFEWGQLRWQMEYRKNRGLVEHAIAQLEEFRSRHGAYPASLAEVGYPEFTLARGANKDEVHYERPAPTRFVVRYASGWYVHTYDSREGTWLTSD
jgi:hypothetical protein